MYGLHNVSVGPVKFSGISYTASTSVYCSFNHSSKCVLIKPIIHAFSFKNSAYERCPFFLGSEMKLPNFDHI